MKKKIKIRNYNRFIGFIIVSIITLILIVFCCIKMIGSLSNNKNDNEIIVSDLEESSVQVVEIQEDNEENKQHVSKVIPLAKGEKSENNLPVLMYHFFYDDSEVENAPNSNYMPISSFKKQLEYLSENDFYYPTWDEVADFVDGKIDLPENSVVLTMDDGDDSVFELALPLLEKYKVPATAFIITGNFEENDLKKYKNSIIDLESHTENMHKGGGNIGHGGIFPMLSLEESTDDLKKSIKKLGGNSGALAYPFGDCTEKTKEAVKNAGFKVAFTTANDKVKPGMDKYELPRVRMFTEITLAGFKYSVK